MWEGERLFERGFEAFVMNEFEMIEKYFAPLSRDGLKDDAAVLAIPAGDELVVTSDTLNAGVHFFDDAPPDFIARKALRVNLSDLAGMGAQPLCYQLNIAFPEAPSADWLAAFSGGLAQDQARYGVFCSGGDTTRIKGALSISITAMGLVTKGRAVKRCGARDGDVLIVTGAVGTAALALKNKEHFLPNPRTGLESVLQKHVNAAADVSDGLLADSMHIAKASNIGLEIDLEKIEFSDDVYLAIKEGLFSAQEALSGGEDYELILAVSEESASMVVRLLRKNQLKPQIIGRFTSQISGLKVKNSDSKRIDMDSLGWSHF